MSLLKFKCDVCGNKIRKINKFWDIFGIKQGESVVCSSCESKYTVPKIVQIIYSLYFSISFYAGIIFLILLVIATGLDTILGMDIGMWVWPLTLIVYMFIEAIVTVSLPLKLIKEKK